MQRRLLLLLSAVTITAALAQRVELRAARTVTMPALADCNSPAYRTGGELRLINSAGNPVLSTGGDQFSLRQQGPVQVDFREHFPMWIESTWVDADGTIYAWYHHEPGGLCGGKLTAPKIGAVVSYDGGQVFYDQGVVLESGDPVDCSARNGFFAGGHGDFSVILDREGKYFYFLFDNYGGDAGGQGVAIARMAFEDRANPAGAVWKYWNGDWTEPGLGGRVSPIFPAVNAWQRADADALWGPSVHWNTHLETYVVLMNHVCCEPMWPRDGVYASFNADLADPAGWAAPVRILEKPKDYYPQVLGFGPADSDTLAGQVARLYIHGRSDFEIVFHRADEVEPPQDDPDPNQDALRPLEVIQSVRRPK